MNIIDPPTHEIIDPMSRFDIEPSVSNHFAWIRTRLSVESTFMSSQRSGIALIGFGFTIVQFFHRMRDMETASGRTMPDEMPRNLGLALIAIGIVSLALSSWQYRRGIKYMWSKAFEGIAGVSETAWRTPAFISGMVIIAIGIAAFVSVFFRFL